MLTNAKYYKHYVISLTLTNYNENGKQCVLYEI
jgi:hypothetical protein